MEALRAVPLAEAAAHLQKAKRVELQKLAKEAGTKANVKNVDIIASLLQVLKQAQDAAATSEQKASPAASSPVADAMEPPVPAAKPASVERHATAAQVAADAHDDIAAPATESKHTISDAMRPKSPVPSHPPAPAPPSPPPELPAAPASPAVQAMATVPLSPAPAIPLQRLAVTPPPVPAVQPPADQDLMADARAMAQQVRTAGRRPPLTPARTPGGRRSLAASALGNRLRALGSSGATPSAAGASVGQPLFGSPAAATGPARVSLSSAASGSLDSYSTSQGRSSMGADAALSGALTSAAPTISCDLSPGLLTLPGTSVAAGAGVPAPASSATAVGSSGGEAAGGWRGATEAQLREMERAWDEYKAGSPGWRAPSPATVAAKGAALAAAGYTTVHTPLRPLQCLQRAAAAAPRLPLAVADKGGVSSTAAGDENAGVITPLGVAKGVAPSKLASASRLPPPTPASSRKAHGASAIPRPSPANIKGPGRANAVRAAMGGAAPFGIDRARRAEEAFQARRALAAVRAAQK